jgi:alpha-tubulin suppressor-like RCC1 family protein
MNIHRAPGGARFSAEVSSTTEPQKAFAFQRRSRVSSVLPSWLHLCLPAVALATTSYGCGTDLNCVETATCPPEESEDASSDARSGGDASGAVDADAGDVSTGAGGAGGVGGAGGNAGKGGAGGASGGKSGTGGAPDAGGRGGSAGSGASGDASTSPDAASDRYADASSDLSSGFDVNVLDSGPRGAGGASGASGAGGTAGASGGMGGNSGTGGSDGGTDSDAPLDAGDSCVVNGCGGCLKLSGEPGQPCGRCGTYACIDGMSDVICANEAPNECGGCGVLNAKPGTSCGSCHGYVCDPGKASTSCHWLAIKQISLGNRHTCALLQHGGVRCWGSNIAGQLGDGTDTNRPSPPTSDVLLGVTAIAAGGQHTCALLSTGGMRCWGWGAQGSLGTGGVANVLSPPTADIANLPGGVHAIAAGSTFTCAVLNSFGVRCWGSNANGQLGYGIGANLLEPPTADIPNLPGGAWSLAAGPSHACAILRSSRGVRCWGENKSGQAGIGDSSADLFVPPMSDAANLGFVSSVAAGSVHTCSLATGGVKCWGFRGHGQLGDGQITGDPLLTPPTSNVLSDVGSVTAGWYHTCALLLSGAVRCWGYPPGTGATMTRADTDFEILAGVTAIDAGLEHTCAVTGPGDISCWGGNEYGQIGDGTTDLRTAPTALPSFCPK